MLEQIYKAFILNYKVIICIQGRDVPVHYKYLTVPYLLVNILSMLQLFISDFH